ncbi:MAG: hypothetical protein CSB33_01130 [Desulfobacterales bacterium]|nr:MAG: hypothetical protein CSB33_01130 [Desulfobacterales bacterium]
MNELSVNSDIHILYDDFYRHMEFLKRERTMPLEIQEKFLSLEEVNCRFLHIADLTYAKDFPRLEAFENIVASIRDPLNFYRRKVFPGMWIC